MHPDIDTPISNDETMHLINLFTELFYYQICPFYIVLVGRCGIGVLFLVYYQSKHTQILKVIAKRTSGFTLGALLRFGIHRQSKDNVRNRNPNQSTNILYAIISITLVLLTKLFTPMDSSVPWTFDSAGSSSGCIALNP